MIRNAIMLTLIIGLSASLTAQKGALKGKEAKPFEVTECINMPDAKTLADCAGEVVLIKFWGIN